MSLDACAESLISICYYRCGPKKCFGIFIGEKKKELEILKTQEVKMRTHWRNGEEKKAFVFIPVLLLGKKLRWKNYSFPT